MKLRLLLFFAAILIAFGAEAAGKYYVFYLHGRIMEDMGLNAESPQHGKYQYKDILNALRSKGYIVISEVREKNTEAEMYGRKVAGQIDSLKKKGIKPEHIAVIGASKGALIASYASQFVQDRKVKYVIMGGCPLENQRSVSGSILVINEKSDGYAEGYCNKPDKANISSYKEVLLNTGLQHGFLYRPLAEWLNPATQWIENK